MTGTGEFQPLPLSSYLLPNYKMSTSVMLLHHVVLAHHRLKGNGGHWSWTKTFKTLIQRRTFLLSSWFLGICSRNRNLSNEDTRVRAESSNNLSARSWSLTSFHYCILFTKKSPSQTSPFILKKTHSLFPLPSVPKVASCWFPNIFVSITRLCNF